LSDPIPLPKRRIIFRPIFTHYTVEYCTECILSKTQNENKSNMFLNNKQEQLNNTAATKITI